MPDRKRPGRMRFEDEPDEKPRRSRGRAGGDEFDDDGPDDGDERRPPRRGASPSRRDDAGRARPGRGAGRSRRSFEDEDDEDDSSRYDRGGRDEEFGHGARPREKRKKLSLLNLCTPLFGYAAVLPKEAGDTHPAYATFRNEVLSALQRVEKEAADHDIDRDDAAEATYALSCFLDEQVATSQWTGKGQWAAEPLGIVRHQDPDGGVNFYERLKSLGSRQNAAKEVFLVCLAFGFKGRYGELDPAQQVAQLGEIRQRALRDIHPTEMERLRTLFPAAYQRAFAVESKGPESRPWWLWASLGVVAIAIALWVLLLMLAGPPSDAVDRVRQVAHADIAARGEARV